MKNSICTVEIASKVYKPAHGFVSLIAILKPSRHCGVEMQQSSGSAMFAKTNSKFKERKTILYIVWEIIML